jgi:hypothetical protein
MDSRACGLCGQRLPLNCAAREISCCGYNSAALPGVPFWPLRFESPGVDLRPGEAGRWCTSSGESRRERQYRGDEASKRRSGNNGGGAVDHEYRFYVGIDWPVKPTRSACSMQRGELSANGRLRTPGMQVNSFAEWLNELAGDDPGAGAVAIEIPRGAVVETLIERGFHVCAINPKQLDRFRDRHTVAGAKDDRRDALVLVIRCGPIEIVSGACVWTIRSTSSSSAALMILAPYWNMLMCNGLDNVNPNYVTDCFSVPPNNTLTALDPSNTEPACDRPGQPQLHKLLLQPHHRFLDVLDAANLAQRSGCLQLDTSGRRSLAVG